MIYIVTGDGPRCGSSMMMQALRAGGLPLIYDPEPETLVESQATEEYNPNPGGRYELADWRFVNFKFPDPVKYGGHVIKVFPEPWGKLLGIIAGRYRMIWMHRDYAARWESFFKAHEKHPTVWNLRRNDEDSEQEKARRDMWATEILGIMRVRRDVRLTEFVYEDVLEQPSKAFWELAAAGWPINPDLAAAVPDRTLKRF